MGETGSITCGWKEEESCTREWFCVLGLGKPRQKTQNHSLVQDSSSFHLLVMEPLFLPLSRTIINSAPTSVWNVYYVIWGRIWMPMCIWGFMGETLKLLVLYSLPCCLLEVSLSNPRSTVGEMYYAARVPNLANTTWCKKLRNDWNQGTWVLIWKYVATTIQWIKQTWQDLDDFLKSLRPCTLDECSLSIGRVKLLQSLA